jgi:hypothetical protein
MEHTRILEMALGEFNLRLVREAFVRSNVVAFALWFFK